MTGFVKMNDIIISQSTCDKLIRVGEVVVADHSSKRKERKRGDGEGGKCRLEGSRWKSFVVNKRIDHGDVGEVECIELECK